MHNNYIYCDIRLQISTEFRKLKPMYASLISDVCRKMGRGMASYIVKRPRNMDDWDEVNGILYYKRIYIAYIITYIQLTCI